MKMPNSHTIADEIASLYPLPIPLQDIVEEEGIILICDDYGSNTFDGLTIYEKEEKQFYIHLNTRGGNLLTNTKGRFTLAHELGHYYLGHHRATMISGVMHPHIYKYNPFGNNYEWIIEREADEFAASLLMPIEAFRRDLFQREFSGHLIDTLAKKYKVSFSASAIRILKIGVIPLMLVYAEKGVVKWQLHSEEFPFYRLRNGNSKVPENSVMGEYFLTKVTTNCHKDEIVFAGDCFHTFWEDQNRMEFFEYCIPYKDKAFSVFWQNTH